MMWQFFRHTSNSHVFLKLKNNLKKKVCYENFKKTKDFGYDTILRNIN